LGLDRYNTQKSPLGLATAGPRAGGTTSEVVRSILVKAALVDT